MHRTCIISVSSKGKLYLLQDSKLKYLMDDFQCFRNTKFKINKSFAIENTEPGVQVIDPGWAACSSSP